MVLSADEPFTPSGLMRVREASVSSFIADELSAYSFASPNTPASAESRRLAIARSLEIISARNAPKQRVAASSKHASTAISIRTAGIASQTSSAVQPVSPLHSSAKYSRSRKGVATTDLLGSVLLINEILCMHSSISQKDMTGRSILDLFAPSSREKINRILLSIQTAECPKSGVLCSGKLFRIIAQTSKNLLASLWLKLKADDADGYVLIWVLEDAKEIMLRCGLSQSGKILQPTGPWEDIFGYSENEVTQQSISALIPFLLSGSESNITSALSEITMSKFFGGVSRTGTTFPVSIKANLLSEPQAECYAMLHIMVLPNIAGMVVITEDGLIKACNRAVGLYLLGYTSSSLIEKESINGIMPQYQSILSNMKEKEELRHGLISAGVVRKLVMNGNDFDIPLSPSTDRLTQIYKENAKNNSTSGWLSPSLTISNLPSSSSTVIAIHRDGTPISVDLQIRTIKEPTSNLMTYVLWITYDRDLHSPSPTTTTLDVSRMDQLNISNTTTTKNTNALSIPTEVTPVPVCAPPTITGKSDKHINGYHIETSLGEGAYGTVKCTYRNDDPTQTKVIIKFIVKAKVLVDSWVNDPTHGLISLEIKILDQLRIDAHPNIVLMLDFFQDKEYLYLEMAPHGKGMDLFDYIEHNRQMTTNEIRNIFWQTCSGIDYLHKQNIVHRDIKDENIILDEKCNIQLVDFGSSAYVKEGELFESFCGTMDYCAPEILMGKRYQGPPQDVWALGILFCVLLFKECPFYNVDEIIGSKLRISRNISTNTISLLSVLLNRDLNERPSIQQVLKHCYFTVTE